MRQTVSSKTTDPGIPPPPVVGRRQPHDAFGTAIVGVGGRTKFVAWPGSVPIPARRQTTAHPLWEGMRRNITGR
jgi:hypothetical protein